MNTTDLHEIEKSLVAHAQKQMGANDANLLLAHLQVMRRVLELLAQQEKTGVKNG